MGFVKDITNCKRGKNHTFPSEKGNHLGNVLAVIVDAWYIDTCIEEIGIRYAAHITQATDYSAFGAPLPGRSWCSGKQYRESFNGKEKDSETELQDYGMRIYNQRLGKFLTVDPLTKKYPTLTPYQFASNCPIAGVDLDGLEFFYAADGTFIGKIGTNQEVRIVKQEDVKSVTNDINTFNKAYDQLLNNNVDDPIKSLGALIANYNGILVNSTSLGIDNEQLIAFASTIHNESSGNKSESYAIGNVTVNFLLQGGSSELKMLEDVTMYDNKFAQGSTQENFTNFKNMTPTQQNSKFALGAAINAVGRMNSLNSKGFDFSDNTNGANAWDGKDLVRKYPGGNAHRNDTWTKSSKAVLLDYQKKFADGTVRDVSKWTYSDKGAEREATAIIGGTLYQKVLTPLGGKKESNVKFK